MRRNIFEEVHDHFRATARAFFERECVPNVEKCEKDGKVSPRRVAGRRRARLDRLGVRREVSHGWRTASSPSTPRSTTSRTR